MKGSVKVNWQFSPRSQNSTIAFMSAHAKLWYIHWSKVVCPASIELYMFYVNTNCSLYSDLASKLNPMAEPFSSSSSVLFVATCAFSYFKAQVGTIRSKRTTVPLMYNLDGKVDGLDVIDFPGVDDKDQSIPQLANLLLGLVQAVIFVVDRG